MANDVIIKLPQRIAKRLEEEARKRGAIPEEYLLELIAIDLDPAEMAKEYIEVSKNLVEEAKEELKKDDVRQAAEKAWGAAALAVKAYAIWKEEQRLSSHGELWSYKRKLERELGEWVSDAWAQATAMHVCFYEGWCEMEDVEVAIKRIERLVDEIEKKVS